jgi:CheY-like chemotaxis protein
VRNPLAAAISATSFVSSALQVENPLATEEEKRAVLGDVGIIGSSLSYVNDLLRNMLDMHKASCDQLRIDMSPACLWKDVFEPIATVLHKRDAQYEVQVDCPETLTIMTDRIRLKQIVLNLASNSCKFVEAGYVRIGASVSSTDEHNKSVRVFVEDSGPGIPAEKRNSLFDKFQSSLDSLSQGTGIGLNLCKDLTQLMGGTIDLDDGFDSGVPGRPGARFVIDLHTEPLEMHHKDHSDFTAHKASASDVLWDAPTLPSRLKVLFVDDDLVLRKLFARSINRVAPNWDVSEAANGETALRLVEDSGDDPFDLLFGKSMFADLRVKPRYTYSHSHTWLLSYARTVDQYMASIQKQLLGTETVRALRNQGFKGIVCGLSANSMEEAFLSAGANAFMFKPFPCEAQPLTQELSRIIHGRDTV